jgi:hypothetical protein
LKYLVFVLILCHAVTGANPFTRWEMGLSCMLEKTAGVIKVEKLHTILLMEADYFNFFNGLMLRDE